MYTSGPKKVAVFLPGPASGLASLNASGQPPKQAINQGPIFSGMNSSGGANASPGSSATKTLPKVALPQPPKLPVVPNTKLAMPGMVKSASGNTLNPVTTPNTGVRTASNPVPKYSASVPVVAPPTLPVVTDSPFSEVNMDDDPPPPPDWIDEAEQQAAQTQLSSTPTFVQSAATSTPKLAPPKVPVGMPKTMPPQPVGQRPASGDFTSGGSPKTVLPPSVPKTRPTSMQTTPVPPPTTTPATTPTLNTAPKQPIGALPKNPTFSPQSTSNVSSVPPTRTGPSPPPSQNPPTTALPKTQPPAASTPKGAVKLPFNPMPPKIPSSAPLPLQPPPSQPKTQPPPQQLPMPQGMPKVSTQGRAPGPSQGSLPVMPQMPTTLPANLSFNPVQPKLPAGGLPPAGQIPKMPIGNLPAFTPPSALPPPSMLSQTTTSAPKQGLPATQPRTVSIPPKTGLPMLPPTGLPQQPPVTATPRTLLAQQGQTSSPRTKQKLHPLLPCPIPDSSPSMPVSAPIEPFPIRFLVSKGETKMLTCSPGSTVIELLTDAMFDLLEHVDGDDFITYHLLCGDEKETIDNSATISDSVYVQECLARGVAPSVILKPSNTLTDLDDLVLDEEEELPVMDAQQAEKAAIEADLGFKLPDYAMAPSNAPQTASPATNNALVNGGANSRPTSGSIGSFAKPTAASVPVAAVEPIAENSTLEFGDDSIVPPPPEEPEEHAPEANLTPAAVLAPPSDAPKPTYAAPAAYTTPKPVQALPQPANPPPMVTATTRANIANRVHARPSVAAFTSNRRSIFENPALMHRSATGRSSVDTSYRAQFQMPNLKSGEDVVVTLVLQATDSIANVKANLSQHLVEQQGIDLGTDRYLFKVPGASFLTNEAETMKSLPYVHNCLMRGSQPMFIVLEKTSESAKRIKKNNVEIGALIGRPLSWVQQDDEITSFRQSMTRLRYFERQNKDSTQAQEKDQLAGLPIHVGALANPTGPNGQTLVSLTLELLQVKKKVPVKADETAAQFIQSHVEKQYVKQGKTTKSWTEFILKPPGLAEYIYGPYALHSFDYVRECIAKNKPVELMLVQLADVQKAKPATGSPLTSLNANIANGTNPAHSPTEGHVEESLEDESFLLDDPTIKYDQAEICLGKRPAESMSCISIWDLHRPFRFRMVGLENISPISNSFMAAYSAAVSSSSSKVPSSCDDCPLYMYITVELYHGGEMLAQPWCSSVVPASNNPRFYEWVNFDVRMANLPRAVRICFTAWVAKKPIRTEYADIPLAWVNVQLFDYKHELRTGAQTFKMWPDDKANPIGTTVQYDGKNPTSLYVQLDTYQLPVVFPTEPVNFPPYPVPTTMTNQEQNQVLRIAESDPLYMMTKHDKQLMWKYREFCKSRPKALPKFLASVPKADARAVQEMHRLLRIWAPIAPIDALELLDSKFADAKVRDYAVRRLEQLSREELLDYLLQLVQVLKYEPYHETAFAELLVRAALSNKAIGHHFFWYLKSEIHVPEISERFGLLLEAYLRGCGPHRAQLAAQNELQLKFVRAANMIKPLKDSERLAALRAELGQLSLNRDGVAIPLNPRIEVSGLKVDKCKYMDSKKLPLWLVFQNADPKGSDPYVIFKSGDDLRQDMLTLQMIRIMDHLWKKADLDFLLNAYGCISTGDEVGMIEVVLNSMTTAAITRTAGGATAAFREDPIDNWIRENNPTEGGYRLAKDRFIYSCAGYCVATYVLGIGDRHNDNIMLTKDGRLFHIDFGHFLGNFKKKFGVKRERAPFVFTPDFAYVMGGKDAPDFNRFLDLCARAYNVLRKHANIFINLFAMMLSTGIPELRTIEDIQYLRDAFSLDLNEQQAAQKFNELVYEAMSSRTTQLNNAIHIWAH